MSNQEKTPLLGGVAGLGSATNYYFLQTGETDDTGAVVEDMPAGADASAFEPKKLGIREVRSR